MPSKGTKKSDGSSTFVDVLTGKIVKITGLLAGIVTLVAVTTQLLGGFQKMAGMVRPPSPVPVRDCLDVTMDVKPTTVKFGKWNTVKFDLIGRNDCKETLAVHVAFKSLSDSMRIEPPSKGPDQVVCGGLENPDCWETRTLDRRKTVEWTVTPPRLTHLGPLTEPVLIDVNWTIYNSETKKYLRAGKAEITVERDSSP